MIFFQLQAATDDAGRPQPEIAQDLPRGRQQVAQVRFAAEHRAGRHYLAVDFADPMLTPAELAAALEEGVAQEKSWTCCAQAGEGVVEGVGAGAVDQRDGRLDIIGTG